MKSILQKIAIGVWALYVVVGVLVVVMGIPSMGLILALPGAFSIIVLWICRRPDAGSATAEKPKSTDKTMEQVAKPEPAPEPIAKPAPAMPEPECVIVDVETTGLSAERDSIIEIAAAKYAQGQIIDSFQTMVNPHCPIPEKITALTGITNKDVKRAPDISKAISGFLAFWGGSLPLCGHNVTFDIKFISAAIEKTRGAESCPTIKIIDTLALAREAFPGKSSYKLSVLSGSLGLSDHAQEHRALSDVELTAKLYAACQTALAAPAEQTEKEKPQIVPDETHPLYRKTVVITGTLSVERDEAAQMVTDAGGFYRTTVSGKTDYLVVGAQDMSAGNGTGISAKERKAAELVAEGKADIQILSEAEFVAMAQGCAV